VAPDTVAAIHRLFAAKRRKLAFMLLGTAAAEVTGQIIVGSTVQSGGIVDARSIDQFSVIALAVPVALIQVLCYARYNEEHEQRTVAAWQVHRLPRYVQHALKAKHVN
jgi:hypothetical protein